MRRSGRDPLKQYQTEPIYTSNLKFYTLKIGTVALWVTTTCSLVVVGINVSQQHSATILYPEGGGSTFLRQVMTDVPTTRRHYPLKTYERIRSL